MILLQSLSSQHSPHLAGTSIFTRPRRALSRRQTARLSVNVLRHRVFAHGQSTTLHSLTKRITKTSFFFFENLLNI